MILEVFPNLTGSVILPTSKNKSSWQQVGPFIRFSTILAKTKQVPRKDKDILKSHLTVAERAQFI